MGLKSFALSGHLRNISYLFLTTEARLCLTFFYPKAERLCLCKKFPPYIRFALILRYTFYV
ncbi:hypothetical protein Barb4_00160 [Bacteroidales bacterium Barb4]|nr:hypothetical protein Barb4_00160 [Bacteroidales bacterium Barb4]